MRNILLPHPYSSSQHLTRKQKVLGDLKQRDFNTGQWWHRWGENWKAKNGRVRYSEISSCVKTPLPSGGEVSGAQGLLAPERSGTIETWSREAREKHPGLSLPPVASHIHPEHLLSWEPGRQGPPEAAPLRCRAGQRVMWMGGQRTQGQHEPPPQRETKPLFSSYTVQQAPYTLLPEGGRTGSMYLALFSSLCFLLPMIHWGPGGQQPALSVILWAYNNTLGYTVLALRGLKVVKRYFSPKSPNVKTIVLTWTSFESQHWSITSVPPSLGAVNLKIHVSPTGGRLQKEMIKEKMKMYQLIAQEIVFPWHSHLGSLQLCLECGMLQQTPSGDFFIGPILQLCCHWGWEINCPSRV